MRKTILFILLFSCSYGKSQSLSEKNILRLNELNIKAERFTLNDFKIQDDLNKILTLDRKRKLNKTVGIILTAFSAVSLIHGSILIYKGNNAKDGHDFPSLFGGLMIASGVIYGGISIPFWASSRKRKKERDKLIKITVVR